MALPYLVVMKQLIGIDPGITTGYAVKQMDNQRGTFSAVQSGHIWQVWQWIERDYTPDTIIIFEDARQRDWFGGYEQALYRKFSTGAKMNAKERSAYKGMVMGAGAIRVQCTQWEDWLTAKGFRFVAKRPTSGATKLGADLFARATGWAGRTNEHARDAGMLINGYTLTSWARLERELAKLR